MDATLLLLSADCPAAAGRRRRPALPAGTRVASPAPCARPRASAAAAAPAARGLPHHASVAGVNCRRRPALPAGTRVASPGPCARPRASVRASAAAAAPAARGLPHHASVAGQSSGIYTVGDFMTKREELHVVKPMTSVDEALEMLVEHRITGFPVIYDNWNLVGVVSDYDLLALDSISGTGLVEADIFPEVDSTWKTFREIQRLLNKTNGKVIGDVMTSPLVVRETTNLEDAARLLLVTKYRRLPVVDSSGKLVGIITRGNVVRAALEIKKKVEGSL